MLTDKQKGRIDELYQLKKNPPEFSNSLTKSKAKNCFVTYPHNFLQIVTFEVSGVYKEVRDYCVSKNYAKTIRGKGKMKAETKLVTNLWTSKEGDYFTKVDIEVKGNASYIDSFLIPNEILNKLK